MIRYHFSHAKIWRFKMKPSDLLVDTNVDGLLKAATAVTKLGLFIGGICVALYSLRIGYFPQDLSLGDGVLFLLVAGSFGYVYLVFVYCLVALGICGAPFVRPLSRPILAIINRYRKRSLKLNFELVPFNWSSTFFAGAAVLLILALGRQEQFAYWSLPLLSGMLYLLYSAFVSLGKKLKKIAVVRQAEVHTKEKEKLAVLGDPRKMRQDQLVLLALILFAPLLYGGVSGQLLEMGMGVAKLRKEHAVVYIKTPYALMLPSNLISSKQPSLPEYSRFDDVDVLFHGFGKRTVVSFRSEKSKRTLKIPDEYIIVE